MLSACNEDIAFIPDPQFQIVSSCMSIYFYFFLLPASGGTRAEIAIQLEADRDKKSERPIDVGLGILEFEIRFYNMGFVSFLLFLAYFTVKYLECDQNLHIQF